MTATCRCGATWGGFRASHCDVCHATFSGDKIGDAHRVGEHTPDTRRCLTTAQMLAKGWRDDNGMWRGAAMSDELKAKMRGQR